MEIGDYIYVEDPYGTLTLGKIIDVDYGYEDYDEETDSYYDYPSTYEVDCLTHIAWYSEHDAHYINTKDPQHIEDIVSFKLEE